MEYTVRPISDRTLFGGRHEYSPFRASWRDTLQLLDRELGYLSAKRVVFEVDVVNGAQIKLDGMLRADAKVTSPAVRIAFESKHGPLTYATDRYTARYYDDPADWKQNVRAIALGLEALRKVDRYGITKRGEQYAGWKALPPGPSAAIEAPSMTTRVAAEVLERVAIGDEGELRERTLTRILADRKHAADVYREARRVVHPDRRDGDRTGWDQVEAAAKVLGLLS